MSVEKEIEQLDIINVLNFIQEVAKDSNVDPRVLMLCNKMGNLIRSLHKRIEALEVLLNVATAQTSTAIEAICSLRSSDERMHKRLEALEKRKDWLPCQNCYPRSTECSFCNNTGVIINEPR